MFSYLSVSLNGKSVTLHETNYHYKAYLEKLLNYDSDASGTNLVSSLWYLDSSQELKDNNGYTTRLKYLGNSQAVELYGRLHADLFNSDKMLINGVDINIKLTRTPEVFNLLAPNDNTKVRTKILDAHFITQVELKKRKIFTSMPGHLTSRNYRGGISHEIPSAELSQVNYLEDGMVVTT